MNIKHILPLIIAGVLVLSCSNTTKNGETKSKISTQNEILVQFNEITTEIEQNLISNDKIQSFITKVDEYSKVNPEDPIVPELLFKAGVLSITVAKTEENHEKTIAAADRAIQFFTKIERIYPENENAKTSMLNRGFVYDEILKDYESAKTTYSDFINRYPTDSISLQLEAYIQTLGMTPEEIMANIKEKTEK